MLRDRIEIDKLMEKKLFLLGGYDLEMITIRELLISLGFEEITSPVDFMSGDYFADRHLKWGASVDSYRDLLTFHGKIYGIELTVTDESILPENYVIIDHHNERNNLPSSIEQVAEILEIELTHRQKLIAANDRGYIPAMLALDASPEEISDIRRSDRQAQGVTENDELLAEKSLKESVTFRNDLIIIESLTPRFSAIADRIYPFRKLLITHDNHLVYYGQGIETLSANFQDLIRNKKAFYGGGKNGFFGLVQGIFSKDQFLQIRESLINIIINL